MVDERLVDYIKKATARGYSTEQIVNNLLKKGWNSKDVEEAINTVQKGVKPKPAKEHHAHLGLLEKIGMVMQRPSEFFQAIKAEEGVGSAFRYFLVIALVPTVISLILVLMVSTFLTLLLSIFPVPGMELFMLLLLFVGAVAVVIGYLISLVMSFVGGGIWHVFVRFVGGGRKGYSNTYKATIYSATPGIVLGWIAFILMFVHPYLAFVGLVFSIWSLILFIKGVSVLHEITMKRAILAALTPVIISLVIVFVAVGLFALGIFNPVTSVGQAATGFPSLGLPGAGSWELTSNGEFSFKLENHMNREIEVSNVGGTLSDFYSVYSTTFTLSPGGSRTITLNFGPQTAGDTYSVQVSVEFTPRGGFPQTDTGIFSGTVI